MLKIGVAGVGRLGRFHAQKLSQIKECTLMGVFDVNPEHARAVADEFKCQAFDNLDNLLQQVDALVVAAATQAHYQLAKQALLAGKHVFVEKPLTAEVWQAEELVAIARENDLKIQVGHVERFNPVVQAVQDQLHNPMFIESHRLAPFTPRGADVAVVLDLMIHDIDLVLAFIDSEPVHISASGVRVFMDSLDIANARLEFANGAVANVTASRVSIKRERKIRFFQQDAYFSLDFQDKKVSVIRKSAQAQEVLARLLAGDNTANPFELISMDNRDLSSSQQDAILSEEEAFVRCCLNNTCPLVDGKAGLRALQTAVAIMAAIEKNTGLAPAL